MGNAQNVADVRWEYTLVKIDMEINKITSRINSLGEERWELVTVLNSDAHYHLIFKRRLP